MCVHDSRGLQLASMHASAHVSALASLQLYVPLSIEIQLYVHASCGCRCARAAAVRVAPGRHGGRSLAASMGALHLRLPRKYHRMPTNHMCPPTHPLRCLPYSAGCDFLTRPCQPVHVCPMPAIRSADSHACAYATFVTIFCFLTIESRGSTALCSVGDDGGSTSEGSSYSCLVDSCS